MVIKPLDDHSLPFDAVCETRVAKMELREPESVTDHYFPFLPSVTVNKVITTMVIRQLDEPT